MDENSPANFFTRLRTLSRLVDQNVGQLKEDLSLPPGSKPHFYDRGLNALKSEFKDVKNKSEEVKKVQGSVQTFNNWLESMQELVNKQADDIVKIEKYLVKFGYKPTQNPALNMPNTPPSDVAADEKENIPYSKDLDSGTTKVEKKDSSARKPLLNVHKQQSVQAKVAAQREVSTKTTKNATEFGGYQKTPVSSKMRSLQSVNQSAGVGSSYNNSHESRCVTVEQWLEGVENYSVELTPDVLRIKRLPMREKKEMTEIAPDHNKEGFSNVKVSKPLCTPVKKLEVEAEVPEVPQTPVNNVLEDKRALNAAIGTPIEPELSEYTTQFLTLVPSGVRKGNTPSLARGIHNRNIQRNVTGTDVKISCKTISEEPVCKPGEICTPEEPILSCKKNNTYCNSFSKEDCALEEPVLSTQSLELQNTSRIDGRTPKEHVLSSQFPKHLSNNQMESKTPEEPVLSYQSELRTLNPVESKTPEEPVLFYQFPESVASNKGDTKTPEEPLLSYQISKGTSNNCLDNKTPEEPVLSAYASAMQSCSSSYSYLENGNDIPASPELSDITVSFLSLRNQSFLPDRANNVKERPYPRSDRQESRYSHVDSMTQFSRNGILIPRVEQQRQMDGAIVQENAPPRDTEPRDDKKRWHRPGVAVEQFLSVDVGDIPPSPQLSETTQRLFARMY